MLTISVVMHPPVTPEDPDAHIEVSIVVTEAGIVVTLDEDVVVSCL